MSLRRSWKQRRDAADASDAGRGWHRPADRRFTGRAAPPRYVAEPDTDLRNRKTDPCGLLTINIRRVKVIGFAPAEIRDLQALSSDLEGCVERIESRSEGRLVDVISRICELRRVRRGLKSLVDACPEHGPLVHCPILVALTKDDPT